MLVLWLPHAVVSLLFPIVREAAGIANTFFGFVVLGLIALFFVYKCVPETKDRSLEELEEQFRRDYV